MLIPSKFADLYWPLYKGLNYRLRFVAGGRWASACRPLSIVLLMTERCNARCTHCDIWKNRGHEETPAVEQWKTVLRDIARWLGPVWVTLSGGEALLRTHTPELADFGRSEGLRMEVLTHGYWMDQRRIERLAMAMPRRITVSVDAIGETHSAIRGRENFWDYTLASLQTLCRLRSAHNLPYSIRLKTVVMNQNLDELAAVAAFAEANRMEVFYQPIEQNYKTPENPVWFHDSPNWPRDGEHAVRRVEELIELKKKRLPIANSYPQLAAMIPYFRNPGALHSSVQSHSGHERRTLCSRSHDATGQCQWRRSGLLLDAAGRKYRTAADPGNLGEAPPVVGRGMLQAPSQRGGNILRNGAGPLSPPPGSSHSQPSKSADVR